MHLQGMVLDHEPRVVYSLYATVSHFGSPNFGHYTSTIRNGRSWVDISDASIVPTAKLDARLQTTTATVRARNPALPI